MQGQAIWQDLGSWIRNLDLEEECDKRGENGKRKSKDEKVNKEGRGESEKRKKRGKGK